MILGERYYTWKSNDKFLFYRKINESIDISRLLTNNMDFENKKNVQTM